MTPCAFLVSAASASERGHRLNASSRSHSEKARDLPKGVLARCEPNTEKSNPYGLELHRPSIEGTKSLFKVIKVIIVIQNVGGGAKKRRGNGEESRQV